MTGEIAPPNRATLGDLLGVATRLDGGFRISVPGNWLQGRTAYGGLSTALALEAACQSSDDLPPLRSAQVAFIGPLSGEIVVRATVLRRGRNVAFVQSDIGSDSGLGFRATFVFMSQRESAISHHIPVPAPVTPPSPDAKRYIGPDDFFTGNFEFHDPKLAKGPAEWLRWVRLRDRTGVGPTTEVMVIGDALPPAAFKLFDRLTPLSTLSWQIDLLDPAPSTDEGWWLLHAHADRAEGGYSSQRMTIWNAKGVAVAAAMQSVAIFG